jgi:tRNA U34 5-carboxymethylaminomethyl modifying GTPase MnmE/TrmE
MKGLAEEGEEEDDEGVLEEWGEEGEQLEEELLTAGAGGGGGSGSVAAGPVRVVVMGLPNSGKSTLMNQLLGWERALTGEQGVGVRTGIRV